MGKIKRLYTVDPNAPKVIEVKLHVYEDVYGRRWYQTNTTWPDAREIRYLGAYTAKMKKVKPVIEGVYIPEVIEQPVKVVLREKKPTPKKAKAKAKKKGKKK